MCVCEHTFYNQSEDILAAPYNFKGLFEGEDVGFTLGLGLG